MDDWKIDYSNWGPGAKRRRQSENARRRADETEAPKPTFKPKRKIVRERLPFEERVDASVSMAKKMIRRLTLRQKSPREIAQQLEQEGIRLSLVTIGNEYRKVKAQERERRSKRQASSKMRREH